MRTIHFLTIFPEIIDLYMDTAMMKRAKNAQALSFVTYDIRLFSQDKHNRVDDTPYGGGAGMVMQIGPIYRAVEHVKKNIVRNEKTHVVLLSAKGKRYTQRDAERLAVCDDLILICGRYEGVDERVAQHIADEEISIGDYVLTGGELGAMVIADSITRLLPDVLGNARSTIDESHSHEGYLEYPQYTKPEDFNGWRVPDVLLSGHHENISSWRKEKSLNVDHVSKTKKK
jgi:tRNA (guanine37-N1)-methyltransferase